MGLSAMSASEPRIVYVCVWLRATSPHYDLPLETFLALNGDTGDVYSAQCSCVSG